MVEPLDYVDFFPNIHFEDGFENYFRKKLKDQRTKLVIKNQVKKIICNPNCGKHLKHGRKGMQEVYIKPQRLYYHFAEEEETIYFLEISHKDKQ